MLDRRQEMAADVWKVKDMYGRVYLQETEKLFIRRFKMVTGDYEERIEWMAQHPNLNAWKPSPPEGYRIINDAWVAQELDKEMMRVYLEKRQIKRMKREARTRGYKV